MGRAWRIKHAVWLGGRCGVVRYAVYYPTCIYLHWVRSGGRAEGSVARCVSGVTFTQADKSPLYAPAQRAAGGGPAAAGGPLRGGI